MSTNIMSIISEETRGKSYRTYKYTFDNFDAPTFAYDDYKEITWERYGETEPPETSVSLKNLADKIIKDPPLFTYFLDGSRHTYKVDDISYKNKVYPVIAGQIGVACCKRIEGNMQKHDFEGQLVIALPKTANQLDWNSSLFFANLCDKVNKNPRLLASQLSFSKIMPYSTKIDEFERIENKGIAVIQDLMVQSEVSMVSKLVAEHRVSSSNYLLKDGSLEYRVDNLKNDRELRQFQSSFTHVVGVSKSFNPENCKDKKGKNNSDMIAQLPLFHRTPVSMYKSSRLERMQYAVWYLRIRDKKYTVNAFDGILKVEKILVTDEQLHNGLVTEEVDYISANLINERNPVCYGADKRWANHLYPVYVTEYYTKSKYLSDDAFLNLF